MNFLRETLERVKSLLARMSATQLVALGALVLVGAVSLAWLAAWGLAARWEPLFYRTLEAKLQGDVIEKLDKLKIPYQLKNGLIQVPAEQKDKIASQLARDKDLQLYGGDPWKWLFESDWTSTEQKTRERILRTNEARLTDIIRQWPRIADARVIITPGDPNRTFSDEKPGKASVMLALKGRDPLPEETVAAIANMVSGAVRDLEPANVKISDGHRHYELPKAGAWKSASDQLRMREAMEEYEAKKIKRALGPVGELAYVAVELEIDWKQKVTEKKGIPGDSPSYERRERKDKSKVRPPGDTPGVSINVEEKAGRGGQPKETETSTVIEIRRENRQEEYERVEIPAGAIMTKRASVTIPWRLAGRSQAGEPAKDVSAAQTASTANLGRWKSSIVALGYKPDDVQLTADAPLVEDAPLETRWQTQAWDVASRHGAQIFLGLLLLGAVGLTVKNLRRSVPVPLDTILKEDKEVLDRQLKELLEGKIPLKFDQRSGALRDRIQELVRQNPKGAAIFVQRWVTKE